MVVEYRFPADENYYVTANARYRRQLWYHWFGPVSVLAYVAVGVWFYASSAAPIHWPSFGPFLLLGVAAIFARPLGRAVLRRRIRKLPTLNDDWVIRLSDDGMSWSGNRGEGRMDWSTFTTARRFADGLLLLQGSHLFYWLSDSACTEPARLSEVGDLVRRHVPDVRDVGRRA